MKLLVEAGYRTTVAPVLTRQTVGCLDHVLDRAVALGADTFRPSLFLPLGRGARHARELMLLPAELKQVLERLLLRQEELEGGIVVRLESVYPGLGGGCVPSGRATPDPNQTVGCSAGTTQLVINAEGKVAPCPFLHDLQAGDLTQTSLARIWHQSDLLRRLRRLKLGQLGGKCRTCLHVPEACRGGCRAAAYLISGDLLAEDPVCWN